MALRNARKKPQDGGCQRQRLAAGVRRRQDQAGGAEAGSTWLPPWGLPSTRPAKVRAARRRGQGPDRARSRGRERTHRARTRRREGPDRARTRRRKDRIGPASTGPRQDRPGRRRGRGSGQGGVAASVRRTNCASPRNHAAQEESQAPQPLILLGLGGLAAFVYMKLTGKDADPAWTTGRDSAAALPAGSRSRRSPETASHVDGGLQRQRRGCVRHRSYRAARVGGDRSSRRRCPRRQTSRWSTRSSERQSPASRGGGEVLRDLSRRVASATSRPPVASRRRARETWRGCARVGQPLGDEAQDGNGPQEEDEHREAERKASLAGQHGGGNQEHQVQPAVQ